MGARGEGWVIGQFVIIALIVVASFVTRIELPSVLRLSGILLLILGTFFLVLGARTLGKNLTPFPKPKDDGHSLVTEGIYGIVRHPIYSGLILIAFGWTLYRGTVLGIGLSMLLFIWFDLKARREEIWLSAKYPDYGVYKERVRRLVPFVY